MASNQPLKTYSGLLRGLLLDLILFHLRNRLQLQHFLQQEYNSAQSNAFLKVSLNDGSLHHYLNRLTNKIQKANKPQHDDTGI